MTLSNGVVRSIILALIVSVCQVQKEGPSAPLHEYPKGMNGDMKR